RGRLLVTMLFIYASLAISLVLCLTGLVLSFVDLRKYNFGLYVALVAIVAFTVALAFFVVRPRACLAPKWFLRLFAPQNPNLATATNATIDNRSMIDRGTMSTRRRSEAITTTSQGHRLMFFGFNTAAFFHTDRYHDRSGANRSAMIGDRSIVIA